MYYFKKKICQRWDTSSPSQIHGCEDILCYYKIFAGTFLIWNLYFCFLNKNICIWNYNFLLNMPEYNIWSNTWTSDERLKWREDTAPLAIVCLIFCVFAHIIYSILLNSYFLFISYIFYVWRYISVFKNVSEMYSCLDKVCTSMHFHY